MKKQLSRAIAIAIATAGIVLLSTNPVMAMVETDQGPGTAIVEVQVGVAPGGNIVDDGINEYRELYENLTEEQKYNLKLTVAAEGRCMGVEGQITVMEVIMNRCLSSKWPDDIWSVITESGQFAGYRNRYEDYVCADDTTDLAIETVINNGYPAALQAMVREYGYDVSPYEYDCFATKMQSQCKKGYFMKQTYNGWKHYFGISDW